jgi:nucleoid-associated protein YgaU
MLLFLGEVMSSELLRRITMSSIAVLAVGGVALGISFDYVRPSATGYLRTEIAPAPQLGTASTKPPQVASATAPLPALPQDTRGKPAFDIVRVEPGGDAVIAGRSEPGAAVELLKGNKVLGRVVADKNGEFVLVPQQLPSGSYEIALRAKLPDGSEATSERNAAVIVEPRPAERLVNVPKPRDEPLTLRSKPAAPSSLAESIVLETVAVEKEGKVTIRGHAGAGAAIKLYLNDTFVTSVKAGADRNFSVTIKEGVRAGRYRVRLEQADPFSSAIVAHAEQQFEVPQPESVASAQATVADQNDKSEGRQAQIATAPSAVASPSNVVVPKITTATVARGDSLWRISQHSYGAGDLYQLIVRANRGKIRNPDLIFPDQVFVLPPH